LLFSCAKAGIENMTAQAIAPVINTLNGLLLFMIILIFVYNN
jgi:hypothetical protein